MAKDMIFGQDEFLPGVITQVQADYTFGYDSSKFGTTDSVLVIGTAFSGPVGVPVAIYTPEHGRYMFGKAYDGKSRKKATLVGAIEDAYQRGCKTIYAMRISGKQISKEFDFAIDTKLKLRVSAAYPSNLAKSFSMVYDNTTGDERIKLFKPASMATVVEKMEGLVESENAVLVTELLINRDYGLTKDSKLIELISAINSHKYNNTLRLYIVDENGTDVTNSSIDAQNIPVGVLMPGAYLIGRNFNNCSARTKIDYKIITNDSQKPFATLEDPIYKDLVLNSDILAPLPIYAQNYDQLAEILRAVEVSTSTQFDFLAVTDVVDRAFAKDKIDYEEVDIDDFEIYRKLGSGFAVTARAEKRVDGGGAELTPKIKETPITDTNRIYSIQDGAYSMLENFNARYRVLSCANADNKITGRLPRPSDFEIAANKSIDVLDGYIKATSIIDEDTKFSPKKYSFVFAGLTNVSSSLVTEIYSEKTFGIIPSVADVAELNTANVPAGTKAIVITAGVGSLRRFDGEVWETITGTELTGELFITGKKMMIGQADGTIVAINVAEFNDADPLNILFRTKKYILGENNGKIFAFKVLATDGTVEALGDMKNMLTENEDKTLIYSQSNYFEVNEIAIRSAVLDGTTLEEFVEMLNENDAMVNLFSFSLTNKGATAKDEYVSDVATAGLNVPYAMAADREMTYDYNKYIPYKTTDNFARQLAQHCQYTALKTAPTHGVIGLTEISDLSLNSIAAKVDSALTLEFDLNFKNLAGRNVLNKVNEPYNIGHNVSILFAQYPVTMTDSTVRYISNGAAGYAGMISQLPLDQSSTNQPIAVNGTSYALTNYQLSRLTKRGFVTIKESQTRGPVITDGITMAPSVSPFRRLAATRIMSSVEQLIRAAAEPFIGKQNHDANRNSMQTAIKSNLDKLKGQLIETYEFEMIVDPSVMKFSIVDIDYTIVPIYEIREVRNRVTVKDEI